MRVLIFTFLWLILASCEKDELPVNPNEQGNLITVQLELGSNYNSQVFYSLKNNKIVSQNKKEAWDLGFEASSEGWHIKMNSGRGGAIAQTDETSFDKPIEIDNLDWRYDASSGNLDSTAIGDYRNSDNVFIFNRGYDSQGNNTGYLKLKIDYKSNGRYKLSYCLLSETTPTQLVILKNSEVNFVCFSYKSKSLVSIEPPKESWDLFFGQYTHVFTNPFQAYIVTGVLSNSFMVKTATADKLAFNEIELSNAQKLDYVKIADNIGYDWKGFDFDLSNYKIFANRHWVIKDGQNRLFKFHFIDFNNDKGEKGSPKFEMQEL